MDDMTELSKRMQDAAKNANTVAAAMAQLREYDHFRTLGDVLRDFAGSNDPKKLLVDGLTANDPNASREAMDKKVRNWLGGRTLSIAKDDAFAVARLLGLELAQTDDFLKYVTGEGIHWREPGEIVWAYAIARKLTYAQTRQLQSRAAQVELPRQELTPKQESYTGEVKRKIEPLLYGTPEELLRCLEENRQLLGSFHNTAYSLFMQYMQLLETAGYDKDDADYHKKNAREILEDYLFRKLVPVAKRENAREKNAFSAIQRGIRANWPDEVTLSKMKKRKLDVSRKALILLFLATDGSESEFEELDEDEDILTRDEIFENVKSRLNRMLTACGFQKLDPRSPFDWVVLFCICVENIWEVDERMEHMLQAMFRSEEETGKENQ